MKPRRARRALAAGAAAVAVLALTGPGCGDDDEGATTDAEAANEQYVTEVGEAINPVSEQSEDLVDQAEEARRIQELSQPLERAERAYQRATDDLKAIEPPDEVEALHDRLVDVHRQITNATAAAAKAARERSGKGLGEFREAGDRYSRRSDAVLRRFEQRGFDL